MRYEEERKFNDIGFPRTADHTPRTKITRKIQVRTLPSQFSQYYPISREYSNVFREHLP
jgi:hypothetical protein